MKDAASVCIISVPDAPSNLVVDMLLDQSDSLSVTWAQAESPGRCDITNNVITWSLDSTGVVVDSETYNPTESYTITGLDPWTTYSVYVSAVTQGGKGPDSAPVSQTTDEDSKFTIIIRAYQSSFIIKFDSDCRYYCSCLYNPSLTRAEMYTVALVDVLYSFATIHFC